MDSSRLELALAEGRAEERWTMSKKPNRLTRALLETADDMREGGLLDQAAYEKITLRHLVQRKRRKPIPSPASKSAPCGNKRT
jgi:hypothetical protein